MKGDHDAFIFHDLALQQPAQGLNGWAFLGLVDVVEENMERIVHEIGHGWMAWPHSYSEVLWRPQEKDDLGPPDQYSNRYDIMSGLALFSILGWDIQMPAPLAIDRYAAGWIAPGDVALHLKESGVYTLEKPLQSGYQFLVIHSGRRHAFTTLEVLEERSSRYKVATPDVYDPDVPGNRRARRYEGVLVSRYDQSAGTGTDTRFGPALWRESNPQLHYDVGWGRDDYALIADGESRRIGGGVTVSVSKNLDGSFDVSVSGGKTAAFERWCQYIWFSEGEYDTGCSLDQPAAE